MYRNIKWNPYLFLYLCLSYLFILRRFFQKMFIYSTFNWRSKIFPNFEVLYDLTGPGIIIKSVRNKSLQAHPPPCHTLILLPAWAAISNSGSATGNSDVNLQEFIDISGGIDECKPVFHPSKLGTYILSQLNFRPSSEPYAYFLGQHSVNTQRGLEEVIVRSTRTSLIQSLYSNGIFLKLTEAFTQ